MSYFNSDDRLARNAIAQLDDSCLAEGLTLNFLGMPAYAAGYHQRVAQLQRTVRQKYWDAGRRLFADTPEKNCSSQHANALAILTGAAEPTEAPTLARQLLADASLAPASVYFKFYLH